VRGHAEIAGGGVGGLSLGMMLAKSGWTVRVHEQAGAIREAGTGIFLKNNLVEVLEEAGMFDELATRAFRLGSMRLVDRNGNLMQERRLDGPTRLYATTRQILMQSLYDRAVAAGVDVVLGSRVVAADASGEITTEDGLRIKADLVVATDGLNSRVRASLRIPGTVITLPTRINRYVLPTREIAPDDAMTENWSGRYRVSTAPCGDDRSYAFQVYPQSDAAAAEKPTDVAFWTAAFPRLSRLFELMRDAPSITSNYMVVRCRTWHAGRIALLGDAAHALPPTLGQGAGLTVMNARALVAVLRDATSIEEALPRWERAVRGISDCTQRWAVRYDYVTRSWPGPLRFARPAALWAMKSVPAVRKSIWIADQGLRTTPLWPVPALAP
jgi:2-polyprenyl-6-methoxyphenol hydroxylase-like FAD-dependent oxidoreductase